MYLDLSTGKTLTDQQAREVEANNRRLLDSGCLADLFKVKYLVKVG